MILVTIFGFKIVSKHLFYTILLTQATINELIKDMETAIKFINS